MATRCRYLQPGEPHGHRRTRRPVTAEAAATTATEATASGRGLNGPGKGLGEGRFNAPEPASPRWG